VVRLDQNDILIHALAQGDGQVGGDGGSPDAALDAGDSNDTPASFGLALRPALHGALHGRHKLRRLQGKGYEARRPTRQRLLQLHKALGRDDGQQRQMGQSGGQVAQKRDGIGQVQVHKSHIHSLAPQPLTRVRMINAGR